MRSFTKDFVAMTLGMFFGAVFAHNLGWFWPIGIIGGGVIGWIVRMLTEPKRIKEAAFKSYKVTISWQPKEDWKNRLNCALRESILIGGWFGWLFGVISIIMLFDHTEEYLVERVERILKSMFNETLFSAFILYILAIFFTIVIAFIFFSMMRYFIFDEWEINNAIKEEEFSYKKMNTVVVHYKIIKYFFLGLLWLVRNIPNDASFIRKTFWGIVSFTKTFLILVHHERFVTCGIYAGVGSLIIFFVVSSQIVPIAIAAVVGALVGASIRPFALSLLERKAIQV